MDIRGKRFVVMGGAGLKNFETLAQSVLSRPMHPYLDEAPQDRIIREVVAAVTQPNI